MSKLDENILSIIKKFFKNKKINKNSSINNVENWDSLNHVNLINLISKKYSIKISFIEMVNISSVDDIIKIIKKFVPIYLF